MVTTIRYDTRWAQGFAIFSAPSWEADLLRWVREHADLHRVEEEIVAKVARGVLEEKPPAYPHLVREDAHPARAHLTLYRLVLNEDEDALAALYWRQAGTLPESWFHAEPPPGELLALFARGRELLEAVGEERLLIMYRESINRVVSSAGS